MSDTTSAPSAEEAGSGNGLPPELRQVGEASAKLNSRIETLAKELSASESKAREAEIASREAELKALATARDSLTEARKAKAEAERDRAAAATADQRVEAVKAQATRDVAEAREEIKTKARETLRKLSAEAREKIEASRKARLEAEEKAKELEQKDADQREAQARVEADLKRVEGTLKQERETRDEAMAKVAAQGSPPGRRARSQEPDRGRRRADPQGPGEGRPGRSACE
jgi:chromosome segregation ATPase